MASTIQIKNSTTSGNSPSSLATGELAINVVDGNFFYGSASAVKQDFALGNLTASNTIISGTLSIEGSGSTLFEIVGSEGQLFSITDSLSGSLFAVSDVSGIPILEVFSDDTVKIGTFNNEAITVSGSHTTIGGVLAIPGFSDVSASLAANSIPAGTISSSAQVDHDATTNFVANEHINHSTVTIGSGNGLTGGGDITTSRTLAVGQGDGISVTADAVAVDATVLRTTGDGVISSSAQVDHDATTNFNAAEHFTQANITTVGTVTSGNVSAILPSGVVSGSAQTVANLVGQDITVNKLTTTELVTNIVSSSITLTTGSNIFGDELTDTHQFTGSLIITGSLISEAGNDKFVIENGTFKYYDSTGDHYLYLDNQSHAAIFKSPLIGDIIALQLASNVIEMKQPVGFGNASPASYDRIAIKASGTVPERRSFRVLDSSNNAFFTIHDNSKVRLGADVVPTASLDITGDLRVSTHITASGNISSSGTIVGSNLSGTNTGNVTLDGSYDYITLSGQTITRNQVDASTDISNLTTTNVSEGTNEYYTDAKVKTKLNTENVVSGSATQVRSFLNVEDGADVTDTANVTAAGALMDSEVDADIKTLSLPANTTISTFGASLVDDTTAAAARTTLGLGTAATSATSDFVAVTGDTMTGALNINNFGYLTNWTSADTDIDGLLNGSTFGGLLQGPNSGHFVLGLKDNDVNDSFAILSGDGNYTTDDTYDKVVFRASANGNVEVGGTLTIPGFSDVSASLAAAVAGGDDLGNHTATQNLNMGTYAITNVGNVDGVDVSTLKSDFDTLEGKTLVSGSSQITHDSTTGFVANEHIDHSTVSITAGSGLTGGGTIAATRTINVGAGDGISVAADSVAVDATVLRTTGDSVVSSSAQVTHDSTTGFVANEHIDHSTVSITAGNGLTGGGTIASTRTLNVGAGDGISVAADSVAVDATVLRTTGDGVISSSAQIDHDATTNFNAAEHFTQANITTVGTIGTGVWQGTAIADGYISSATTWNNKLDSAGTIATNDYAKFDASGDLTGRSYSEVKTDLSLNNVENTALSTWAGSSNITTLGTITTGTWQGSAISTAYISNLSGTNTGDQDLTPYSTIVQLNASSSALQSNINGKQDTLTFGIANTNAVKIDHASVADNDYAKFTANGLEGRSYSEVKTDLSLNNVTNESKATMFTSPTFTGTVAIPGFSDVSASLAAAVAGGDNLGNHTATQNLDMGTYAITNVGNVDGRDVSADGSKLDGIEAGADVTDTANVTAAGALMDSEVDADIKTLSLPANTTISTFGASLVDDADAAAARTTLGVDAAGTDNSTNVTLAGSYDYITLSGQTITRNQIDLSTDVTGQITTSSITNFPTEVSRSAAAAGFGSGGGGGGVITALNNQAENRLVTIGSTTTELDGEANITFNGTVLSMAAAASMKFTPGSGANSPGIIYKLSDYDSAVAIMSGDYMETTTTVSATAGYTYNLSGSWGAADASSTGSAAGSRELLAMAIVGGTNDTFLLKGVVVLAATTFFPSPGTYTEGCTVYLDPSNAGRYTFTAPSSAGNVSRIIGHTVGTYASGRNTYYKMYYNPSPEWIEL